jgi:hypothetical protein
MEAQAEATVIVVVAADVLLAVAPCSMLGFGVVAADSLSPLEHNAAVVVTGAQLGEGQVDCFAGQYQESKIASGGFPLVMAFVLQVEQAAAVSADVTPAGFLGRRILAQHLTETWRNHLAG